MMQISIYAKNGSLLLDSVTEESIRISGDLLKKSSGLLKIKTFVPVKELTSVWHSDLSAMPPMKLPWAESFSCGATKSFPLLCFLDQRASVSASLGLTDMIDDCTVTAKMNQESCAYEVTFSIVISPETEEFEVFIYVPAPGKKLPLAEVLSLYRKTVIPVIPAYPENAWKSVYCTWYAVHAALTDEYMLNNAREASGLGFGTFIVDDGWCFEEAKRVTPETLPDWYRDIGDWEYSEKKLPCLKENIKKIREYGLTCLFWVAPFFCGRRSKLAGMAKEYLTDLHEGQRIYDVKESSVTEKVVESICSVYKELDLDGLKIDFIDTVLPNPEKPRCRIAYTAVKDLIDRVKTHKKEALFEFRQRYATPLMASLATAFRAGDVPFDYMENFSRCVQIRLLMGDRIPVHADPVYFNREETLEAVGRHLIAALAGVPMVSMELNSIREEHKKVIKNYLAFYRENQHILNMGHWEFDFHNNFASSASCTLENEKIVILADSSVFEKVLKDFSGNITILNMTMDQIFSPAGRNFDALGANSINSQILPSGGKTVIKK